MDDFETALIEIEKLCINLEVLPSGYDEKALELDQALTDILNICHDAGVKPSK